MITYRDVSHYDYERGDRGDQIAGDPLLVAKATEGTSYTDPRYSYWRDAARQHGVPFVAYHYVHSSDPGAQADRVASVVDADVPLMLDVEPEGSDHPSVDQAFAVARAIADTGRRCTLVYLPHWYWGRLGRPDLRPLAHAGMALVSSNYPAGGYSDDGPGWDPYGGVTPAIWQYTSTPHDLNAYRGSPGELLTLVGLGRGPAHDETHRPAAGHHARRGDTLVTHWDTCWRGHASHRQTMTVQGLLLGWGLSVGSRDGQPDGDWGPVTERSVRDFQERHHVPDSVSHGQGDGRVGPHTIAWLIYGRDVT